jgi:hypothetical protein
MNDVQVYGIVNTIVSATLGGGIALLVLYLTSRFDATKRRKETLRERGEELYVLSEKWINGLFIDYLRRSDVMQGKLTFDQMNDLAIAEGKRDSIDFSRIQMLIDVYFPSTRPAYERVGTARDVLRNIASEHKRAYEAGDIEGSQFSKPFFQAMQNVEKAANPLKEAIIRDLRSI